MSGALTAPRPHSARRGPLRLLEVRIQLRPDPTGGTRRLDPRLTGLRGLAVLWVVLYHLVQPLDASGRWFPLLSAGYLGVPVFLMLSISLLLDSLDARPDLGRYYRRRIRRIWPLYFLTLGLVFVLIDPGHSVPILLENAVFAGVWIHGLSTGLGYVLWTVQVEEAAYVTYPLLHRLHRNGQRSVALGLLLASSSAVLLWTTAYIFLPITLACFGWGILVHTGDVKRYGGRWLLLVAALAILWPDATSGWGTGILLLPGFAWLIAQPPRLAEGWWVVALGEMSYSIYLIHKLLLQLFGIWGVFLVPVAGIILEGGRLRRSLTVVRSGAGRGLGPVADPEPGAGEQLA
jgi:peptidoglycan/LPS O-acetylase OafA/YrhL